MPVALAALAVEFESVVLLISEVRHVKFVVFMIPYVVRGLLKLFFTVLLPILYGRLGLIYALLLEENQIGVLLRPSRTWIHLIRPLS